MRGAARARGSGRPYLAGLVIDLSLEPSVSPVGRVASGGRTGLRNPRLPRAPRWSRTTSPGFRPRLYQWGRPPGAQATSSHGARSPWVAFGCLCGVPRGRDPSTAVGAPAGAGVRPPVRYPGRSLVPVEVWGAWRFPGQLLLFSSTGSSWSQRRRVSGKVTRPAPRWPTYCSTIVVQGVKRLPPAACPADASTPESRPPRTRSPPRSA